MRNGLVVRNNYLRHTRVKPEYDDILIEYFI